MSLHSIHSDCILGFFVKYDSFFSHQVVQLQGHGIQERLIANDPTGRRLSLPLEYPVDVTVVDSNTRGQ